MVVYCYGPELQDSDLEFFLALSEKKLLFADCCYLKIKIYNQALENLDVLCTTYDLAGAGSGQCRKSCYVCCRGTL